MKNWKKELIKKMEKSGNYFYLRSVANDMGIRQIKRQDVESIITAFLAIRPDMKAYFDDSNNNSLFCGVWFANKDMVFENDAQCGTEIAK